MGNTILIAEDEETLRFSLTQGLVAKGFHVMSAEKGKAAVSIIKNYVIDLVLLDLQLPDASGIEILSEIKKTDINLPVIIMTAHGDIKTSVAAMKKGAYDYILKPFELDEMIININKALEHQRLKEQVEHIRLQQKDDMNLSRIVAESSMMKDVVSLVEKVSQTPRTSVLIYGESGVGKEMIANLIHYKSSRASGPFIKVNCAAIPDTMLEAELFGYEKGAFTDARNSKKGLFELANGGTILLDEIGEMNINLQPKLLRIIEAQSYRRIGGTTDLNCDVRIIASTNKDIVSEVKKGDFREDLFYRLNVMPIYVPPLRERREDIPFLTSMFINQFNREFKKRVSGLSKEVESLLLSYPWPGNIRELKNVIERAMILAEDDTI
ncbi:MAG: sigma-54-dependent Fis family transcriptional regulator, partial [Nitrospirae bacterium]|nr:sigma-54-dependent Fis family transcriptional regulator [Nitrospirota bacterium]